MERADGARVAGNSAAQSAQLRHASSIANQLVGLLRIDERALKSAEESARELTRALRRAHGSVRLSRSAIRRASRGLGSKSFSRYSNKVLAELGFTAEEIKAAWQDAPAVSIKRFTAPFPAVLQLGARSKAIRDERAALATFARRHALGR